MLIPILCAAALLSASRDQTPGSVHLEAEDGELVGTSVSTAGAGFSGKGFVTGFVSSTAKVILRFSAKPGIYEAKIRYSSPSGPKGFGVRVNGHSSSGMFPKTGDRFEVISAGKVELSGQNELEIERGWGYFNVDSVDFVPSVVNHQMKPLPGRLADLKANDSAKSLYGRLSQSYGHRTLSGQYDAGENYGIAVATGKTPAIYGGDFMDYSPSRLKHGAHPEGTTEAVIKQAKAGQAITMSWHWNAPTDLLDKLITDAKGNHVDLRWYKGFYTDATTFDLAKALDDPKSERYSMLLSDMDAIAVQLKKFQDAGVPVLWRPLHEAEGGWFWWGAKGPKPFIKLWRIMFDRFTRIHRLHNLIWVFTVGDNPDWYPGDEFVDVLGIDAYPSDHSDALNRNWESLKAQFDGRKLLAISEFGGVPDIPRMRRFGAEWAYFVSWTGQIKPPGTSTQDLRRIYSDTGVQNR